MAPVALGPVDAPVDGLDHPGAEHHAVEQRVRRQAVGAHHAVAARLAGHPQAREARTRRRGRRGCRRSCSARRARSGSQSVRRVEPDLGELGGDRREPLGEALEAGGVEPQVLDVLLEHASGDGPAHLVAREELVDEPLARRGRAGGRRGPRSASVSSGRGITGWWSAVGWNCSNSTSATATPARIAMATPSPVASVGVGGDGEQLAVAAGGHEHVGGPHLGAAARRVGGDHPAAAAALDDQVEGEGALVAPPTPRPARRRRASARSPRRWPRPRRARCAAASGRPPGPARAGPAGSRSKAAPRAMSSWTRDGPSSTSTRTASTSHSPAPAASVSARWRSVESGSPPSTAATPPWAQRVVACWSSALVSTPTRIPWISAARTAADSPATPEPSTSRSRSATGKV